MKPCICGDCTRLRATQGKIPEHLREGLLGYFVHHEATGGFLMAVLSNDLMRAVCNADAESRAALRDICLWVYNDAEPGGASGSPEKVRAHLAKRRTVTP